MIKNSGGQVRPSFRSVEKDVSDAVSDHELMVLTARGDKEAFEELCDRHLKTMLKVAQRIMDNAAEADEVVQESFFRLWAQAPKWDPCGAGTVKTWLSRVVTNLCLDRCRRRRSVPLETAGEIEETSQSAQDIVNAQDRSRLVQDMLARLPDNQRVAMVLAYFEEMSGKDIAQAMRLSVGAVESLLVRARRSLRHEAQQAGLVWGEDV